MTKNATRERPDQSRPPSVNDTYHKLPRNKDSKQSTAIVDPETNDIFIPWVIEPSTGVERALMAVLFEAYDKVIDAEGQERVVLRIMPHLSPVKAAIIVSNDSLFSVANIVKRDSQAAVFGRIDVISSFDTNIDLQYQFSIGTPICFVINEVDNGNFLQVKVFERDTDITTIISLPEIKTKIL